jgi:hypothetical protein
MPTNECCSAKRSDFHIAAARNAVLEYFDAPAEDYVCIFTANATHALRIVGESFPFGDGSSLIIPADCHNSVNGIRRFAAAAGAKVEYLESPRYGGFYEEDAMVCSILGSFKMHVNSLLTRRNSKRLGNTTPLAMAQPPFSSLPANRTLLGSAPPCVSLSLPNPMAIPPSSIARHSHLPLVYRFALNHSPMLWRSAFTKCLDIQQASAL